RAFIGHAYPKGQNGFGYFLISLNNMDGGVGRSKSLGSLFSNAESVFSNWFSWSFKGENSDSHIISSSRFVFSFLFLLTFLSAASTTLLCFRYPSKILRRTASILL